MPPALDFTINLSCNVKTFFFLSHSFVNGAKFIQGCKKPFTGMHMLIIETLCFLRLSGCLITREGCGFLASALQSDPSHLIELDLSYNNLGESGVKMLSKLKNDPQCKLSTLK